MTLLETTETAKFVKVWRNLPVKAEVLNVHGHAMQGSHWPDVYIVHPIYRGWIEFKGPNTAIRPGQKALAKKLHVKGDVVYFVRFLEIRKLDVMDWATHYICRIEYDAVALLNCLGMHPHGLGESEI